MRETHDNNDDGVSSSTDGSPDCPLLSPDRSPQQTSRTRRSTAAKPQSISALACLAVFLWVLSGTVAIVPGTKLVEDRFCRRHYGRGAVPGGDMCKVGAVQSRIAYVFGFAAAANSLVGALVALPFGALADRARRPVYLLGALGQFLNVAWSLLVFSLPDGVPVELVLLGPAFELVGGGLTVATAILYAIISDVQTPENKTIWYFFFSLSAQSAAFVGPPIGAMLMGVWSPWVPLSMVLVLSILAGSIILLLPETAGMANAQAEGNDVRKQKCYGSTMSQVKRQLYDAKNSLLVLKRQPVALIMLTFMLIIPINLGTSTIFLQYFSARFHRSLEDAGYMLAIKGGFTILVMGIILPILSKLSNSPASPVRLSPFRKDLVLAQASAAFSFIGFLVLAGPSVSFVVSGLVILTLGTGIGPLCRSLLTNFAQPGQTSQLFTLVSIIETIGSLVGGPLLAWTFSTGMRLQGSWVGLPYFFLCVVSLLSWAALCFVRDDNRADGYSPLATEETLAVDRESEETSLL